MTSEEYDQRRIDAWNWRQQANADYLLRRGV
jgi:hypothetical protein